MYQGVIDTSRWRNGPRSCMCVYENSVLVTGPHVKLRVRLGSFKQLQVKFSICNSPTLFLLHTINEHLRNHEHGLSPVGKSSSCE